MGIFLAGAWLAISGKGVTAGVVIVFVQLMNYILNPISQVPLLWSNRKAAIALMEKLSDALSENVREEGREKLNGFSEKIEVKDLTYGYEPESPVLKDLDVQFDAGKSYAIVGGSGSGKSTLLNLLMGSSSNYQGEICIDGVSIKNIESESLYQLMTSVQQNVFVFNDTIRNNVTMFHEFPDKEVTLALERSGLSVFVMLCTLDYKKNDISEEKERDMSHALKKAIQSSVRKGDFYTKYNMRQYIIMLIGISQENCPMVSRRIEKAFRKCSGEKKSLQVDFYVASVGEVCESDGVIVDRRT